MNEAGGTPTGTKSSPSLGVECEERGDCAKDAAPLCHPSGDPLFKRGARHSFKLWHRAPSESDRPPISLSHVRQTLESGVPAPPRSASLDAAGQWLVCGAGTSPTEIPRNHESSGRAQPDGAQFSPRRAAESRLAALRIPNWVLYHTRMGICFDVSPSRRCSSRSRFRPSLSRRQSPQRAP
jgi:hypothetical protein